MPGILPNPCLPRHSHPSSPRWGHSLARTLQIRSSTSQKAVAIPIDEFSRVKRRGAEFSGLKPARHYCTSRDCPSASGRRSRVLRVNPERPFGVSGAKQISLSSRWLMGSASPKHDARRLAAVKDRGPPIFPSITLTLHFRKNRNHRARCGGDGATLVVL